MNNEEKDDKYENKPKKCQKPARSLDKEQFGNCRICNCKANGIHYGVASCEGCKVISRLGSLNFKIKILLIYFSTKKGILL
jgi:hypothetical protein